MLLVQQVRPALHQQSQGLLEPPGQQVLPVRTRSLLGRQVPLAQPAQPEPLEQPGLTLQCRDQQAQPVRPAQQEPLRQSPGQRVRPAQPVPRVPIRSCPDRLVPLDLRELPVQQVQIR